MDEMKEIDEMKAMTKWLKAFLSTLISRFLRKKGMDIDIVLNRVNITHAEGGKINVDLSVSGSCTEDELMKLAGLL